MSILRRLNSHERILALLGALCVLVSAAGVAANPQVFDEAADNPVVTAPTPEPEAVPEVEPAAVLVTTAVPTAMLTAPEPGASRISALREGIPLPVMGLADGYYHVLTPCEYEGWIPASDVHPHQPAPEGHPERFEDATFVLDAGHGGWDPGAVGPGGLTEEEINLILINRILDLLRAARTIDPETGAVVDGEDFGTPRVFLTRSDEYTAGLRYRATIASHLRAHGFISIHNNAEPDGASTQPGTEIFYQTTSADSRRLAGLIYEELFAVLSRYNIPWVADRDAGVKYRVSRQTGDDYYGLLRRSDAPAVLVEAMFISNHAEEALLRDPAVQQAIAEAVYRGLVRYIVTDDPGSGFSEPYPRGDGGAVRTPSGCVDPG